MHRRQYSILVCRGPECGDKRNSAEVHRGFVEALRGCPVAVELGWQSCFGRCTQGPNVLVREVSAAPAGPSLAAPRPAAGRSTALYNGVTVARIADIVRGHVLEGRVQRQFIERPRLIDSNPIGRSSSDGES